MAFILSWLSLVLVSVSLIYIGRWVRDEAQIYALFGLIFVEISFIYILITFI